MGDTTSGKHSLYNLHNLHDLHNLHHLHHLHNLHDLHKHPTAPSPTVCVITSSPDDLAPILDPLAQHGVQVFAFASAADLDRARPAHDVLLLDVRPGQPSSRPSRGGLPRRRIGPYLLTWELGRGSYGAVYAALDTRTQERVALKLPFKAILNDPENAARFERETQLLRELHSPYVCRYLDHGALDGQPFLAMELVKGVNLESHIRDYGPLPEPDALQLLEGLARACQALEVANVVHRDIKPANVILRNGDPACPVLVDFGLIKPTHNNSPITNPDMIMGSPGYLPPEYIVGDDFSHRGDLFSIGMTTRFALTGAHYLEGLPAYKILTEITEQGVNPLTEGSRPLRLLLQLLCDRDPQRRPPRAAVLASRIDHIRQDPLAGVTPQGS